MTPQPDPTGHFGPYGGRFVPEVLMAPLEELEQAYLALRKLKASAKHVAHLAELKQKKRAKTLTAPVQYGERRRA